MIVNTTKNNKNSVPISFSGGCCRAHSSCLGVMRSLIKNNLINKIPYISAVSGSSWLIMILTYNDKSLNDLLFDINFDDLKENKYVNISTKLNVEYDLVSYFYKNSIKVTNSIVNKYIINNFNLTTYMRRNWPMYIINSSYKKNGIYRPIEFTPNYSLINDVIVNNNSIKQYNKKLSITNIIASSSYINALLPSIFSYDLLINNINHKVVDGAFIDIFGILPLLRRKCKKIFSVIIPPLNSDKSLKIKNWIYPLYDPYENIFEKEDWDNVLNHVNNKVKNKELCYYRGNIRVKNNEQYRLESYTTEILFYFVSNVKSFTETLPMLIVNLSEMENFPNFPMFFSNRKTIFSLTLIQTYSIIKLTEWSFDKILKENLDFF